MSEICKQYKYSKSGFYKHLKIEKRRNEEEARALYYIRAIRKSGLMSGARKMKIYLKTYFDFDIGRDRLFKLMKQHDLYCRHYRKKVITSDGRKKDYPNLIKNLEVTKFGEVLVSDISYISLQNGKFCYISVISDLCSRMILGYNVSSNLMTSSIIKTTKNVIRSYKLPKNSIHHSDHGSQYTSHEYTGLLNESGIQISMTGSGKCFDNAVAERIFNTLKNEYDMNSVFNNIKEVKAEMKRVVNSYNNYRVHDSLNDITPRAKYEQLLSKTA
jgi:transposase InsO family protein